MYTAAIVEDEDQIRQYFKSTLQKSFKNLNLSVSFEEFATGDSFITSFINHQSFDIIFLDIEMPGTNGIEVCRRIRKISASTIVIFISSKESLVFDTFEVAPFRFIRKRYFDDLLPQLVQDIAIKLESDKKSNIQITEESTGNIYTFDINDLLYVEAQRKDCCFVTRTDNTVIRTTIGSVLILLKSYDFIQTHRSYLVNMNHIFLIGKDGITLTTKDTVPLSRGKIEEVKKLYLDFTTKLRK